MRGREASPPLTAPSLIRPPGTFSQREKGSTCSLFLRRECSLSFSHRRRWRVAPDEGMQAPAQGSFATTDVSLPHPPPVSSTGRLFSQREKESTFSLLSPGGRVLYPSPTGRRWRAAPDEGVQTMARGSSIVTDVSLPHPPFGHLLPGGEGKHILLLQRDKGSTRLLHRTLWNLANRRVTGISSSCCSQVSGRTGFPRTCWSSVRSLIKSARYRRNHATAPAAVRPA